MLSLLLMPWGSSWRGDPSTSILAHHHRHYPRASPDLSIRVQRLFLQRRCTRPEQRRHLWQSVALSLLPPSVGRRLPVRSCRVRRHEASVADASAGESNAAACGRWAQRDLFDDGMFDDHLAHRLPSVCQCSPASQGDDHQQQSERARPPAFTSKANFSFIIVLAGTWRVSRAASLQPLKLFPERRWEVALVTIQPPLLLLSCCLPSAPVLLPRLHRFLKRAKNHRV